jgi:hypothetical protein
MKNLQSRPKDKRYISIEYSNGIQFVSHVLVANVEGQVVKCKENEISCLYIQ